MAKSPSGKRGQNGQESATEFGRLLRELMRSRDMSQTDLARELQPLDRKLDEYSVSKYASGNRLPKAARVALFARKFPEKASALWGAWRRDRIREVCHDEAEVNPDAHVHYRAILEPDALPSPITPIEQTAALADLLATVGSPVELDEIGTTLTRMAHLGWRRVQPDLSVILTYLEETRARTIRLIEGQGGSKGE